MRVICGLFSKLIRILDIPIIKNGLIMALFNLLTLHVLTLRIVAISTLIALSGCANKFATDDYLALGDKYQVVIERDHLGVPHIIGERDVDAAFGFAYAQAEDNWQIIHDTIPFYRGTNAAINGQDAATVDFLIQWLGDLGNC